MPLSILIISPNKHIERRHKLHSYNHPHTAMLSIYQSSGEERKHWSQRVRSTLQQNIRNYVHQTCSSWGHVPSFVGLPKTKPRLSLKPRTRKNSDASENESERPQSPPPEERRKSSRRSSACPSPRPCFPSWYDPLQTTLQRLDDKFKARYMIRRSDIGVTGYTIEHPGTYQVVDDIEL